MPLSAGNNVLLRKPNGSPEHLWVVLTNPDPLSGEVVLANLTKKRAGRDSTVELSPGEHPFVTVATVVYYADARLAPSRAVETARGRFPTYRDFEGEVLERMQRGLFLSPYTPQGVRDFAARLLPHLIPPATAENDGN